MVCFVNGALQFRLVLIVLDMVAFTYFGSL